MSVRLEFKPEDCWIGVFWRWRRASTRYYGDWWRVWRVWDVWICLLPMLPIHVTFAGKSWRDMLRAQGGTGSE